MIFTRSNLFNKIPRTNPKNRKKMINGDDDDEKSIAWSILLQKCNFCHTGKRSQCLIEIFIVQKDKRRKILTYCFVIFIASHFLNDIITFSEIV